MKKLMVIAIALCFTSSAFAAKDYGIELGARQQNGDVSGLNFSANSQVGFQGGMYVHMPLEGGVAHFRTGLFYTQRPLQSESDITGQKIDFNLDYLDIPIDILFKPNEQFGLYLGFITSINIAKSCSGSSDCKVSDIDTPMFPFVMGFLYKFTPKVGVDFYMDGANGSVAKGLGNYKAVGLNLTYSLD